MLLSDEMCHYLLIFCTTVPSDPGKSYFLAAFAVTITADDVDKRSSDSRKELQHPRTFLANSQEST